MGRRWTDDSIRRELEAFLRGFETFPPDSVFRAGGRRELWQAMARRGEPERFAEDYGLPYRRNHRAINEAVIPRTAAGGAAQQRPSLLAVRPMARRPGCPELVAAIDRSGGPQRRADELGIPLRNLRGRRWTSETTAAARVGG